MQELITFDERKSILIEAHISDLHMGVQAVDPQTEYEILYTQFISKLKSINVDIVSIDGDVFDHKVLANSSAVFYTLKLIDDLVREVIRPKNATLVILAGTLSHDSNQLKLFYNYMLDPTVDIRIVEVIKFEYIKGKRILMIPELNNIDENIYTQHLFNSGVYDSCFIHGTISGSVYGDNSGSSRLFHIEDFVNCSGPILGGHVHTGGNFHEHFYYCGSPIRYRFGEENTKGFLIVLHNLDTQKYLVHLEEIVSFKYSTINLDDLLNKDPKYIVDYINKIKLEQNIDYIRVEFESEVQPNTKSILDSFFRNDNTTSFKYDFSKQQKIIENRLEEDEEMKKYSYLFDKNLTEYDILAKYINDSKKCVYVTADIIKKFMEEEI